MSELEGHVESLKRNLKEAEEQRQRQVRELEQVHKQDKYHIETLHEKQVSTDAGKLQLQESPGGEVATCREWA